MGPGNEALFIVDRRDSFGGSCRLRYDGTAKNIIFWVLRRSFLDTRTTLRVKRIPHAKVHPGRNFPKIKLHRGTRSPAR